MNLLFYLDLRKHVTPVIKTLRTSVTVCFQGRKGILQQRMPLPGDADGRRHGQTGSRGCLWDIVFPKPYVASNFKTLV